jgi:thioredoxin 1
MSVIHIKSYEDYLEQKEKPGYLVVKYSAEWCGPCKAIAKDYEDLATDYNAFVRFLHVDVDHKDFDDEEDLQDIKGVPTFKIFKNSKKLDQFSGADVKKLRKLVEKHCAVTLRTRN